MNMHVRRIATLAFVAVLLGLLPPAQAAENRKEIDLSGPGWRLWRDANAQWRNDPLFLPPVDVSKLPVNPPTGGWGALEDPAALDVNVPGTAEEYLQKVPGPQAAAELNGVTWWYRQLQIPASTSPRKIILRFEATRQRAEVFVNQKLVGYDLIGNTPYDVDISHVVQPGDTAQLAVRITNPGGNYDWHDKGLINWGENRILFGHGFGGITGRVTLLVCDPIYIDDLYVQNLPAITDINAFVTVNNTTPAAVTRDLTVDVLERNGSDRPIVSAQSKGVKLVPGPNTIPIKLSAPQAKLWDPDHPNLYVCRAALTEPGADVTVDDSAAKTFGFRWFEPVGIGSHAMFRLNGKRIVLRSAISWGLFPINGLIATSEMAEKQVLAAKAFGLNMLNFHRCIGQPIILEKADELGLLYYEEPGDYDDVGKNPITRAMAHYKALRMVQRDRSHPSLIIYCMSNETAASGAQLQLYESDMTEMHQLDPSRILTRSSGLRSVIGIDKPLSTKVHFRPFDSTLYDTGWYDDHHSGGPETWTQSDYRGPDDYYHRVSDDPEIKFWGEEGAISTPPRLGLIKEELEKSSHLGWDGQMYLDWYRMFDDFLTDKHLRDAFPTVDSLCESMGNIAMEHQGRKTELMRISNTADAYVINGWDAEIIENHSGIVDAFRNPKGDPSILAQYNRPLYVAVMVRQQVVEVPGKVAVDFYVVNEKNLHGPHQLQVTAFDPAGRKVFNQTFNVNLAGGDTYGQLLVADVRIPVPANAIGAFTINGRILDPVGNEMASGHDSILGVDWKSDKLAGTGAIIDSGSRLRRFFERSEGMNVPDYSDGLPRLDWVVVAGAPDRAGPELVPAAQLRDPTGQKPGLLATYFNDMSFSQKAVEHIDETVDASAPEGAMIDPAVSTLSNYSVRWEDAYWRAANYLSVGQIYLYDNPLLKRAAEARARQAHAAGALGHDAGTEFHLCAPEPHHQEIRPEHDLHLRPRARRPGAGGNTYLEGTYSEIYPNISQDEAGLKRLFTQFSFPGGIPSHASPECPGSIHEGGELGYSLSHAFGAVFDNPDLIVACVVGDGEAETGPLATAWHSNKFLNPATDGAVLPILHLNGYKIANPTILARISARNWSSCCAATAGRPTSSRATSRRDAPGHGRDARCRRSSRSSIQQDARARQHARPRWPMIVLNRPRAGPGRRSVDGLPIEGTFRAHQVPLSDPATHPEHLQAAGRLAAQLPARGTVRRTGPPAAELAELAPTRASGAWAPIPTPTAACCCAICACRISATTRSKVPKPGARWASAIRMCWGRFLRDVAS
jgi:beta-galactosidase